MNQKQRKVLFIMDALTILMFLFPPYVMRAEESGNIIVKSGYSCIFALPRGSWSDIAPTVKGVTRDGSQIIT